MLNRSHKDLVMSVIQSLDRIEFAVWYSVEVFSNVKLAMSQQVLPSNDEYMLE